MLWMDDIHFASLGNHGKPLFAAVFRGEPNHPGLLSWCRISSIHSKNRFARFLKAMLVIGSRSKSRWINGSPSHQLTWKCKNAPPPPPQEESSLSTEVCKPTLGWWEDALLVAYHCRSRAFSFADASTRAHTKAAYAQRLGPPARCPFSPLFGGLK